MSVDAKVHEGAIVADDGVTNIRILRGSGTKNLAVSQEELAHFLTDETTHRHHLTIKDFDDVVEADIKALTPQINAMNSVVTRETNQSYDAAQLMRDHAQWWRSHLQTHSIMFIPSESLERHGNPEHILGYYVPGTLSWMLFAQGDKIAGEQVYSGLMSNHVVTPGGPGKLYPFKDTAIALPTDVLHWVSDEELTALGAVISSSFRLMEHCQPGGMYKPERKKVPEIDDNQTLLQLSPRYKTKRINNDGTEKVIEIPNFTAAAIIMNRKVHQEMYAQDPERRKLDIARLAGLIDALEDHAISDKTHSNAQHYADIVAIIAVAFTPPGIAFDEVKAALQTDEAKARFDGWLGAAKKTHYLQERICEVQDELNYGPDGKTIPVSRRYLEAGQDFNKMWQRSQSSFSSHEGADQLPAAWLHNVPFSEQQATKLESMFAEQFTGQKPLNPMQKQFTPDNIGAYEDSTNAWADSLFKRHIQGQIVKTETAELKNKWRGIMFNMVGHKNLRSITGEFLLPPAYEQPYGGLIGRMEERCNNDSQLSKEDIAQVQSAIYDVKMLFYALKIHTTPFKPLGFTTAETLKDYAQTIQGMQTAAAILGIQREILPASDKLLSTMNMMAKETEKERQSQLSGAEVNRSAR